MAQLEARTNRISIHFTLFSRLGEPSCMVHRYFQKTSSEVPNSLQMQMQKRPKSGRPPRGRMRRTCRRLPSVANWGAKFETASAVKRGPWLCIADAYGMTCWRAAAKALKSRSSTSVLDVIFYLVLTPRLACHVMERNSMQVLLSDSHSEKLFCSIR